MIDKEDLLLEELENSEATTLDVDDGGPNDVTNTDRARRTQDSLVHYANLAQDCRKPAPCVISDFLCDLMHLCRMNGLDFDRYLETARNHHEDEKEGNW